MATVEEGYLKNKYGKDLDNCTGLMSMEDFMIYKMIVKKRRNGNEKKKIEKSATNTDKIM